MLYLSINGYVKRVSNVQKKEASNAFVLCPAAPSPEGTTLFYPDTQFRVFIIDREASFQCLSSNKIHPLPLAFVLRIVGGVAGVDLGEHPGHVVGQGAHGLHALGVERRLAFGATVNDVPILRGHHRHIAQLEHHVQTVEGCCGATATAHGYPCGGLVLGEVAACVENTLHHRQHTAVRLTVIGGRAYDEGIRSGHLVDDLVARVIVKHAMFPVAAMAPGDAAMQGLGAELHQNGLHTMFVQLFRYLAESGEGVAVCSRASVDHQYFHFFAS